jgi:hypothetical protein
MDSLQDILGKKTFDEPDEVSALQNYVKSRYKSDSSVRLQRDSLILSVPNSALAATLQLNRQQIIKECNLTKKLAIRTGR